MSVIDTLIGLVEQLYQESDGYAQNPADAQLWYNRGYANGMVSFLQTRGHADKIKHLNLDAQDLYTDEQIMEWHKAYHHGFEMGLNESKEINKNQN